MQYFHYKQIQRTNQHQLNQQNKKEGTNERMEWLQCKFTIPITVTIFRHTSRTILLAVETFKSTV